MNHHQWPGKRTACKDIFSQRSPIQATATLDVALFSFLAITTIPNCQCHQESVGVFDGWVVALS
ncbi:hypothetical protein J6590_097767, partial [Homalodisca vitripennis]